jgi:hypothetical protein
MKALILAVLAVAAATSAVQAKSRVAPCPEDQMVCQWKDPKAAAAQDRTGQCSAQGLPSAPGGGRPRLGAKCGCPPVPLIPQHQGRVVCKRPG